MLPLPTRCPICGGEIVVTRLGCRECDTIIESRFSAGRFSQLSAEQLDFIEVFVRYEGKITHMEDELGISYPTIRNRLHTVIRALGYEPGGETPEKLSDDGRQRILEELDQGQITLQEAMRLLQEGE
jgi:hypothetical protein